MAITQITSQVIADSVISQDQLADNSVDSRHIVDGSIDSEHLSVSVVTGGPIAANINLVQSNVVSTQTNVNSTSTNVAAVIANATANFTRANANIDIVSQNVTNITNDTTDLNIDNGTFFIDKSVDGIGINNTAPFGTSVVIGSPANIIFNYGTAGANVVIGSPSPVTGFTFDLKGTANTGAITATSVSSAGVELRANDYATYLMAKGGIDGANTALSNEIASTDTDIAALEARRVANIAGAVSSITTSDLTVSRAIVSDGSGKVAVSDVTATEVSYLDGVTSSIQTQITNNDTDITNLVTGLNGANTDIAAITDGSTAFTGAVTMNDDLTVQGNLTVAGSFANLAVQDSFTDDRLLYLANNFTGSPSLDVGLLLNRGDDGNVFIGYDESQGEVALLHNFDPATNTAISGSAAANLRLNTGYFDDGTASAPSITFDSDPNTGIWRAGAETISFTTAGTNRFNLSTASFASPQTGGIRLTYANGTAAAPAFNFSGDADTGMYRTGADGLGFSTGGTAALTIADNQDASFASNVDVADGQYIRVGDGGDLKIFHSGTSSTIQDSGTGNLYIAGQDIQITNPSVSEIMATFTVDGAVTLYYDNAVKLTTKTDGVDITGELQSDSLDVDGNADISGTLTMGSHIILGDSDEIQLGASTDLKIYHNGTDSYVDNVTGSLVVRTTANDSDVVIASDDGSGGVANYFLADGSTTAALLYFGGSAKLTTKTDGVDITGELQSDSLDVDGNGDIAGTLTISSGGLVVHDSNGSSTNSLDLDYNGTSGAGTINVDSNGGSTYLAIGTSNSGTLTEKLRITNTGNLLVGTTSSGFDFDARGTSNVGVFTATSVTADTVTSDGVELRANDYITYTQLNANLNAVSSNADAKVDKAGDSMTGALAMGTNKITGVGDPTALQDAATKAYVDGLLGASIVPTYVTNTSVGTSNVIALTNSPASIDRISVALNGVVQAPTADWIFNGGNNSIQYTVASLPSGLVTVISAWDTP